MDHGELDALVAEKVMGWYHKDWKTVTHGTSGWIRKHPPLQEYWYCKVNGKDTRMNTLSWSPSTNIAAAWQVVSKMKETQPFFSLYYDDRSEIDPAYWFCDWSTEYRSGIGAKAESAPLAICLAALKTVGVNIENGEIVDA
ncbi:MAG: hypothetical protein H0U60_02530 [Blastocatellia bacterium]|nr:hypothetical protein [Blastocatellia bacterium]